MKGCNQSHKHHSQGAATKVTCIMQWLWHWSKTNNTSVIRMATTGIMTITPNMANKSQIMSYMVIKFSSSVLSSNPSKKPSCLTLSAKVSVVFDALASTVHGEPKQCLLSSTIFWVVVLLHVHGLCYFDRKLKDERTSSIKLKIDWRVGASILELELDWCSWIPTEDTLVIIKTDWLLQNSMTIAFQIDLSVQLIWVPVFQKWTALNVR